MSASHEVLVVGAGIAGTSAVLWLHGYGVPLRWVDAIGRVGGTLLRVYNRVDNYPGRSYPDGRALADDLEAQARALGLAPTMAQVMHLDVASTSATITGHDAPESFAAILVATGVRPRRIGVHPRREHEGRVLDSGHLAAREIRAVREQGGDGGHVLVVGGADGAFEAALLVARAGARRVTLAMRGHEPGAQPRFVEEVRASDIELRAGTTVGALEPLGSDRLRVELHGPQGHEALEVDRVVLKIGFEPIVPCHAPALQRTAGGYLATDARGRTSAPRIFAAGDLASPGFQSLVLAAAQGAHAAHTIATELGYRR